MHLDLLLLEVVALLLGVSNSKGVDHQRGDRVVISSFSTEWFQDFNHVRAVIDSVDQVLLMLLFDEFSQLSEPVIQLC